MSGKRPVAISLDDYYLSRQLVPLRPDGQPDLECLEAIDVPLFNEQLIDLLAGIPSIVYGFFGLVVVTLVHTPLF